MRQEAAPDVSGPRYRRVPAASRSHDAVLYVCPTGWSGCVFELGGAAAAVWESLAEHDELVGVADWCGVDPADQYLTAAVDQLADAGLVHVVGEE